MSYDDFKDMSCSQSAKATKTQYTVEFAMNLTLSGLRSLKEKEAMDVNMIG